MNAIEILRAASRSVPNEDYVQFMAAVDAVDAVEAAVDALEKAELHLAAIGTPRDAQGRYHKDGEWTFGEALPRDADAREVSAAFALVRAAIAKAKGEQP
jgi:predicted secreted hydrolase